MQEEIRQLLPLIKAGKVSELEVQALSHKIKQSIKEDPSLGKELGELLRQVYQAIKVKDSHAEVNWVPVGKGFLAIGHKPGGKISFEGLKSEGTSAVLTLLNENEGALNIGKQLERVDIKWLWFPFSASKPHEGEALGKVRDLYSQLSQLMNEKAKVYVHCSAGIHRTGMISYGFLRFLGMKKTEAFTTLETLRKVTAEQVGEHRLLWADQFGKEVTNVRKDDCLD